MKDFLGRINVEETAEEVLSKDRNATLWDLIVKALSNSANIRPYIIWILSDLQIIESIARGHSADYIAESFGMKKHEVFAVCRTWGMYYWKETLDFDPLASYVKGEEFLSYKDRLKPILAQMPSDYIIENAISNVEKYWAVKEILDAWEEEK